MAALRISESLFTEREPTPAEQVAAEHAEAGGLMYVSDTEPGIRRRRRGERWVYIDPQGAEITDPEEVASILVKSRDAEGDTMSERFRSLLTRFDRGMDTAEPDAAEETCACTSDGMTPAAVTSRAMHWSVNVTEAGAGTEVAVTEIWLEQYHSPHVS